MTASATRTLSATDGVRHSPNRRSRLVSGDSTNDSITASVMGTRTSWAR